VVYRLSPARLAFAADGTPWSEAYGDPYHSADGGIAQSRHVFLAGNGLPERWAGRERFVILETGFGFGLNFLTTWQAWRRHASRCARLHYVAVENAPFGLADLRALHERYPELAGEAAELHARWPLLVPGAQRIELERGRVILTLFFHDVAMLRQARLRAQAIYLDGFSPAKNPQMWSPAILRALARLAAPAATLATWSVAAEVQQNLSRVGFAVEKHPGFGAKREMLRARYCGEGVAAAAAPERRAIVVGAGLAGAALCERLCARGWGVTLLEREAEPAQGASGNHASVFHPVLTADDSVFARLTRAGFLAALEQWRGLEASGPPFRWDLCGVLQLARNEREENAQRAAIAALCPPPEYAQCVTREEASRHAGVAVAAPGLWFPRAGWIKPVELVRAQLDACGERLSRRFATRVERLEREGGHWIAHGASAELARAPVLLLANAADAVRLSPLPDLGLRRVRGQLTYLAAGQLEAPHVGILRGGLVLPVVDGVCVLGASFGVDDDDAALREEEHQGNLERLKRILPGALRPLGTGALAGRVGHRAVASDRLPLAGRLRDGLYGVFAFGSRGLIWAPLASELVAGLLEDEPLALDSSLVDALDPSRFAKRAARRRASRA
jgi:tRNA 5-methylaminomethyl-2-thiouridine biosynthesis bifunctional protein